MNHSEQQKIEELKYLKKFFNCAKLTYKDIQSGETPDFICNILSKKIGIELVQYHPVNHNHGKCKRDASGKRKQEVGNFIHEYISIIKDKNTRNYQGNYDELWLLIHTTERENSIPIIDSVIYSTTFASYKFDKIYFLYNDKIYSLYTRPKSLEIPISEEKQASMYIFIGHPQF